MTLSDSQMPPAPNRPDLWDNLVGCHLYPGTDLGLPQVLTTGATSVATPVTTIYGATVVVLSQLASGTGTLLCDVEANIANLNLTSPSADGFAVALSGTKAQVGIANTRTATPVFELGVACATNMGFVKLDTLVLYELLYGEDYFSIADGGFNAVATSINGAPNVEGTVGSGNLSPVLTW